MRRWDWSKESRIRRVGSGEYDQQSRISSALRVVSELCPEGICAISDSFPIAHDVCIIGDHNLSFSVAAFQPL